MEGNCGVVDGVGGDLGSTARSLSLSLLLLLLLMLLLEEWQGGRESGVVVVGAGLMCWDISSPTEAGVTLSIKVKEGSNRTVVGAEAEWSCWGFGGMGIFDAESISSCFFCVFLHRAFVVSMEFVHRKKSDHQIRLIKKDQKQTKREEKKKERD